jgi:hypothetical protein
LPKRFCSTLTEVLLIAVSLVFVQPLLSLGEEISYERLRHLIESKKLTTVNDTLAALPEEFRSNFTLIYSSGSTQPATFEKPRALLFTQDAKFILAFNDIPDADGKKRLEMVQFRDDQDVFEFYSIRFDNESSAHEKAVFFSEKDPYICSKCHYDDLRPNWDPFPITAGVFGSSNDRIFFGSKENEGLEAFSRVRHQGPYSFLPPLKIADDPNGTGYRLVSQPNKTLGEAVNKLNLRRIRRILKSNPMYPSCRYALTLALNPVCLATFEGHITSREENQTEVSMEEILTSTIRRRHEYAHHLRESAARYAGVEREKMADLLPLLRNDDLEVAGLRFIVEGSMKSSMRDWAMTREADSFIFSASEHGIEYLGETLYADFLGEHPDLASAEGKNICEELLKLRQNSR